MSEDLEKRLWVGPLLGVLSAVMILVWIAKIGFFSGIAFGFGFSLLKRFVIKLTALKQAAAVSVSDDVNDLPRKLVSEHNHNLFYCTGIQFFVFLVALANSPSVQGHNSAQPPNIIRERPEPIPQTQESLTRSTPPQEGQPEITSPSRPGPRTQSRVPLIENREWTDQQGRRLTAELLRVKLSDDGYYYGHFRRPSGERFTYPIGSLSTSDVDLVRVRMGLADTSGN